MEGNGNGVRPGGAASRKRWDDHPRERRIREMSLYNEYIKETSQSPQRRQSIPLQAEVFTTPTPTPTTGGTIRAVPREETGRGEGVGGGVAESAGARAEGGIEVGSRGTTSFENAFIPHTTTTITGGAAAAAAAAAAGKSASGSKRLIKERDGSRNGSSVAGMLVGRSASRSNRRTSDKTADLSYTLSSSASSARPRTRTLDERRRERSPTSMLTKNRNRIASINSPSSGAEYLASVPASTSPPSAPSIKSISSPVQAPSEMVGRRSISPMSSSTADSMASSNPQGHNARRILHLMKTLNGRMSGNVLVRRGAEEPWLPLYCSIQEDSGSLMYEPKGAESGPRILVSGLRGCGITPNLDGETAYLELTLPHSETEVHIKLLTQTDFDSWYAVLLYWQSLGKTTNGQRPDSSKSADVVGERPPLPPRTSSAKHLKRDRAESTKSDRRKSVVSSLREAPVIKIGKMIFWDTNVGYSTAPAASSNNVGQPSTSRPPAYRMQSHGSKRWRRISGQLRENGELKLHSDADNSLISVVQLSQLSRCAIQRLDASVLESEFCLAIYPQYMSGHSSSQPGFLRPIFLSLENRVLFEVWFVLMRAFTIPQLYGPRLPSQEGPSNGDANGDQDLENMLATTTTDMFRMERTLSIRVIEAKMHPPTSEARSPDSGFSGGRSAQALNGRTEQHGYYSEIMLDNETRGKSTVKYEGLNPLWGESFEFLDLPPVLTSANVVIKRRPPDSAHAREQYESKLVHEAYGFTTDQHGGFTGLTFDATCGKVEIYLQELEEEKEVEKWWPVVNSYGHRVGEVLIKAQAEEGVILMARDYQPLSELLHRFSNGITLQIAQMVPGELKRLSDCLLNIFQVSGRVGDWLMALVEEEIDGIHKETPISRLRYNRRVGSDASGENAGMTSTHSDRELIVRDMNKNATLEANLLFRGNTLLTKSLDTHMRRIGKEYLEEALAAKMKEINDKDPDCEVDPNRLHSHHDVDRNWRRLLSWTQELWKAIINARNKCPVELRVIFRHIRACAEDRYGDFLRSVSYSSVSGFLFLRFFCPAVLNPKLFGVLKEDVKPRARRTFTLIAKSLQTLSNMASFGTKEAWMEPMNAFLVQNRDSFKSFIDDMCYVPVPLTEASPTSPGASPTYGPGVLSADTHLSYTTPMTIMQRLPPTSREGFPSLPYLIDQARAFAELVQLWLEATTLLANPTETTGGARNHAEVIAAIRASEGDLVAFHEICTTLHKRTQECLNRAERAERPNSALSFRWEELIDQLQTTNNGQGSDDDLTAAQVAARELRAPDLRGLPGDRSTIIPGLPPPDTTSGEHEWNMGVDEVPDSDSIDEHANLTRLYDPTPPQSSVQSTFDFGSTRDRPGSSGVMSSLRDSLRRAQAVQSRGSNTDSPAASASTSVVSSDTEASNSTTALPNYQREIRHRERREAAKAQIKREVVEAAAAKEREREKRRGVKTPIVSALRRKERREREGSAGNGGGGAGSYPSTSTSYG